MTRRAITFAMLLNPALNLSATAVAEDQSREVKILREAGASIETENGRAVRLVLPERFDTRWLELVTGLKRLRDFHAIHCKTFTDDDVVLLKDLTNLQKLSLPSNMTDKGMQHLAKLKELRLLHINNGRFTDAGLKPLAGMSEMRDLSLWRCTKITGSGLKHLAGMKRLRRLDLRRCASLDDEGMRYLAGLRELQILDLSVMPKLTDRGFQKLKPLKKLAQLGITRTGIRDLSIVAGFRQLESLNVPKEIGDAELRHLAGLTRMRQLSLEVCPVTDAGLKHLEKLRRLEWLDVHRTKISDRGIETLKKLTRLKYVQLQSTLVTAEGIDDLRRELPTCQIVK